MDDLINFVGIDAKHSFQDGVEGVVEFKEKYGDRLCILGGLDMHKLATYDQEHFELYAKDVLQKCMKGGGFAFGTGNSPATYIKLENYYRMLEIGKKFGVY